MICVDSDKGDNIALDNGTEIKLSGPMKRSLENVPSSIDVSLSPAMSTPIMLKESPKHAKTEHDNARTHKVLEIKP